MRVLGEAGQRLAGVRLGHVTLQKRLPVAAGIGGGSADAAALLRLIAKANPERELTADLGSLAERLGADVPVCVLNRAAVMSGVGERVRACAVPPLPALLVNALMPVPGNKTAAVFTALAAPRIDEAAALMSAPPVAVTVAAMLAMLAGEGNDLEPAARRVMPHIGEVLSALRGLPGARVVRLSGAGPTCFALFEAVDAAQDAETLLRAAQPGWWVSGCVLG